MVPCQFALKLHSSAAVLLEPKCSKEREREREESGSAPRPVSNARPSQRLPFPRPSHRVQIELIGEEQMAPLFAELAPAVAAHHARAMNPSHPSQRGTAQGPDVYMQALEAANPFHAAMPGIVQAAMDRVAAATGRRYRLFDYVGHPEVGMGGCRKLSVQGWGWIVMSARNRACCDCRWPCG